MTETIIGYKAKNKHWVVKMSRGQEMAFRTIFRDEVSARHFLGQGIELEKVEIKTVEIKK
jgi:hypothetical protein